MSSHEAGQLSQYLERARKEATEEVSRPKMQKVPEYMAARVEFKNFYMPQFIAIGPFHYDANQKCALGDQYKCKWTDMYLEHAKQTTKDLCSRISLNHKKELFNQFSSHDGYNCWRLVLDGCSILQVLEKSNNSEAEQELKISLDKLVQVHQDLLILDNQIPFQVLRLLCNDEARLKNCLQNFLASHGIKPDRGEETGNEDTHDGPVHLLDYLRRALLKRDQGQIPREVRFERKNLHLGKYRNGTIRELKAAGIRVKKDPNNTFYPRFSDGVLYLPELTMDGSTALIFLNLIAYEMCPDFRNDLEITSYVVFMSSLIDQPQDVKKLRSAGILINQLANDTHVADLFNKMDTFLVPETSRFSEVTDGIHNHLESRRTKVKMLGSMGEAHETYLPPWIVIALLAGSLYLVLPPWTVIALLAGSLYLVLT